MSFASAVPSNYAALTWCRCFIPPKRSASLIEMKRFYAAVLLVLLSRCTPPLVPVNFEPFGIDARTSTAISVNFEDFEKAKLTRGAVAKGALGTKWEIDASEDLKRAVTQALNPLGNAPQSPVVTVRLADFDVDWTATKLAGTAELTVRALVHFDYVLNTGPERQSGSAVGRGRYVDTGYGPRIDQRIDDDIQKALNDATVTAVNELVRALQRLQASG